jgi:nitrile hydratase
VDGIHDLGGMHGFGKIEREPDEPVFHARFEGRVLAMVGFVLARGIANIDAFRHGIERMRPRDYLANPYYGRWLASLEGLVREAEARGKLVPADAPYRGFFREVATPPRFRVGEAVVARNLHPEGHTRLPRYARGRRGVVVRRHPACVFPDTNAHGRGECPQHLYAVRFESRELFGADGEANASVTLDLFESYLDAVAGA